MKAKITKYNLDTGKTLETFEENVIVTLGEYPEEMPVVAINLDSPFNLKKSEGMSINLDIEQLQKEISLINGLKWIKAHR